LAFVDETIIEVSSGNGGPGAATFRREKYVPRGGPDGGDGGRGGDVIFIVEEGLRTLSHISMKHFFKAEDGKPGRRQKKHGHDGQSVILKVPPGTIIRDPEDDRLIKDLKIEKKWIFLAGGKGGKGNTHFKTSTRQAPSYSQPGLPGTCLKVKIELNLVADIGFVGLPNAGKSTLLSCLSNARPKIAEYAFTTKEPNLGVFVHGNQEIVLADIPGLIKGASDGAGMGIKFLKHISRTAALAFLIDLGDSDFIARFPLLLNELERYGRGLEKKKRLVIGTKLDLPNADTHLSELVDSFPDETVLGISAHTHQGFTELARALLPMVQK
jgi:GTPase